PAAQAPNNNISITAPSDLTVQNEREWHRLKQQHERAAKRVADRERRANREQARVDRQARKVAQARQRLAREESRLTNNERALRREIQRVEREQQELAKVRTRMVEMGGTAFNPLPPRR
ncbi:MAG: hypothetical protein ACK4IC_08135, partial [Erythrobacter sp.]